MRWIATLAASLLFVPKLLAADGLVVHEWGTFTCLQDATGQPIGAITADVEPLPSFIQSVSISGPKGYSGAEMSVTMRLETPVVYFHLPAGSDPIKLNFSATFHGGLLTQFYPHATPTLPSDATAPLTESTSGTVEWKNITVGKTASGPETKSPVWLAPRQVKAADVSNAAGESERYLFYRGVGHLNSPISVLQKNDSIRCVLGAGMPLERMMDFAQQKMWLADVRPDGSLAWRSTAMDNPLSCALPQSASLKFEPADYSPQRRDELKSNMKAALIAAGLFGDEADAMLKTWDEAYFKSPGTRVFFIVPRNWTDQVLPISVSAPAKIERVMIGRIDLVTPALQSLARQYIDLPHKGTEESRQILNQMGRFAQPIILHESQLAPAAMAQ